MPLPKFTMPFLNRHRSVDAATLGLAALIAWLTLTPVSGPPPALSHIDKVYHLIAFGTLILPCALFSRERLTWFMVCALIFAGAIELIQPYVGRSGEWLDFVADGVGIGLGAWVGKAIHRITR